MRERLISLPRINLSDRALCDLELLLVGGFAPLRGFHTKEEYDSVVERMRLPSGELWPMPITLSVPAGSVEAGSEVILCDRFGNPLAFMEARDVWQPDRSRECAQVFGSEDPTHPGVRMVMREEGEDYVGGPVELIALPARHDFRDLRHTPEMLKSHFRERGHERVVAFQTRNPIHRAHAELMRRAAREADAHILIHPVVGLTKEGDIDYVTRTRAYRLVHQAHLKDEATLSLLPLAMRMAGPREALWHALIRKNYGATHFIVGRDHAGPGKDASGREFYGPYDAHAMVREYQDEIGVTPFLSPVISYVAEEDRYLSEDEVKPHHTVQAISGTEVRRMLRAGEELPGWFSFPETVHELKRGIAREGRQGVTLFFTGLSGAGKSTVAQIVHARLTEAQDRAITFLDGDVVRTHLSKGLGFSRDDRIANVERIGFVAAEVARHGGIAICSAIAPHAEARERARELVSTFGTFIEIYVATPIEECEKRDVKGLYQKARAGKLTGFTGIDDPYEAPRDPEITIDTTNGDAEAAADIILGYLAQRGFL
jgi:sulfate adenylyltransferase